MALNEDLPLSERVSYPMVEPDMATRLVVRQLLFSLQKWDGKTYNVNGVEKTVEEIYQGYFGAKMRKGPDYEPMLFRGTGGHGKTSSIVDAFKIFCKLTGLNPVMKVDANYIPSKKDALLNVVHAAGTTSSIEFQLPVVHEEKLPDGTAIKYVTSLPERSFAIAKEVGFYNLYLDDFLCTNSDMQNMWMNVIQQRHYKGMDLGENSYVLASGNLGYDDDSYVTEPSLPMKGRFPGGIYFLQESVEGFANRMNKKYGALDNIGDAGIIEFIEKNPKFLIMTAEQRGDDRSANISNPRGLEAAIKKLRVYFGEIEDGALDYKGRPVRLSQSGIEDAVKDQIGPIAAKDMSAHLIDLASGIGLVARDIVQTGQLSDKPNPEYARFSNADNGNKTSSTQDIYNKFFGEGSKASHGNREAMSFQFIDSLARETVYAVSLNGVGEKENLKTYVNFAKGLTLVDPSFSHYAYHRLAWRLKSNDAFMDGSTINAKEAVMITTAAGTVMGKDHMKSVSDSLIGVNVHRDRMVKKTKIPTIAKEDKKLNL